MIDILLDPLAMMTLLDLEERVTGTGTATEIIAVIESVKSTAETNDDKADIVKDPAVQGLVEPSLQAQETMTIK
jgi:hypothetical protein